MFSAVSQSDASRLNARKSVVLANVHHFNSKQAKNKVAKRKSIMYENNQQNHEENKKDDKEMVKIFDQDFDKVFNIMLGINRSIYWLFESPYYEIQEFDYLAEFEYNNQWYTQTGKNANVFTFTDYAPKIFENIRKLDRIHNEAYSNALGPTNIYKYCWSNNMSTFKQLCSTGKSGSLFYYTEDGKFMLKTIHKAEFLKMREILKSYHEHLLE